MSPPKSTIEPGDPIDVLVPAPRAWWIRLLFASALVVGVGVVGYLWRSGTIRPAPDCCGSSSSSTSIGQSDVPDAVTVIATFYNSSSRAIAVTAATAELPGATVVDVAAFRDAGVYELPPESLVEFPVVVQGHTDHRFAVAFTPDHCDDRAYGQSWGEVRLKLEVAGDPWYPTFGRTVSVPVLESGPNQLVVLPPASLDDPSNSYGPLETACLLLGNGG